MKKLLLTLLFACSTLYAQDSLVIRDLSGGKVDAVDATLIPDNAVSDCRNVLFDEEYPASKRKGMTKLNSSALGGGLPVLSQFEYKLSNGTRYHIVHSSTTIYYRLSGSAFTALYNTASATYPANYCVFMDTLTVVDGVNNMKSWDTSAVFTQNATYQPRYIIVWQNRIWIAGDADERSKVRCSEWLDPRDYTVPSSPASTDPAVFDINSQDGQKVMGFALSPDGSLLIFKEKSVWSISGYDRDDFYLKLVLNDIGCSDSRSVTYKSGQVTWLSDRGFIAYNGQSYSIISDNISNTVESIQQLNIGAYSFSKSDYNEWVNYSTRTACDLTDNSGKLKAANDYNVCYRINSNSTEEQSIASDGNYLYRFYQSTETVCLDRINLTDYTTNMYYINKSSNSCYVNGVNNIVIDGNNVIHVVYHQRVNSSANFHLMYASASVSDLNTWSYHSMAEQPDYMFVAVDVDSSNNPHIIHDLYSSGLYTMCYSSYSGAGGVWCERGVISSTTSWKSVSMVIDSSNYMHCVGYEFVDANITYLKIQCGTTNDTQTVLYNITIPGDSPNVITDIDCTTDDKPQAIVIYENQVSGYFYTTSWDEDIIKASIGDGSTCRIACDGTDKINLIYGSIDDDALYYKQRLSSDAYTDERTLLSKHYGELSPDLCVKNDSVYMQYSDTSHNYYIFSSTNSYVSEIFDTGITDTYYFDQMYIDQASGDYNINHYMRSDDTAVNIATNTWTAVTVNNIPSITPKRYIQYRCIISSDALSANPGDVNNVLIQYHTTAGNTYVSSMVYEDRIWNAVSISSVTYLDRQLVWDSNGSWADMTSYIGCSSLFNYNGIPYWGGSNGYVYTMDTGESDDGQAIPSYVLTKAYDLGSLVGQKTLDGIYLQADDSGDWNLTLDYYLDRSVTAEETFSIDLDQTANLINYKAPSTETNPFYTLQYKLSNNGANEPWDFLGLFTFTSPMPLR